MRSVFLALPLLLWGCDDPTTPDALPDAGGRALDAGLDATRDVAADAAPDVHVDAEPDAAPDAAIDAAPDAAPEPDVEVDAAPTPARLAAEAAAEAIQLEALMTDVEALADDALRGRDNLSPGGAEARAWLEGRLAEIGLEPAGVDGYAQPFDAGINLVGRLPGARGEGVLVMAHYDHIGAAGDPGAGCRASGGDSICNGAVDNASGVAVLLGVAEAAAALEIDREITFLLTDAEEDGLLGAYAFIEWADLSRFSAVINVDTVGGEIIPGTTALFALNVEFIPEIRPILDRNSDHLGARAFPVSRYFDGSEDGTRNDAYPLRLAGLPALFYSSGATPEYHTPADEVATIDPPALLHAARHVALTALDLSALEAPLGFIDPPHPHIGDAEAMLYLGERVQADPDALGLPPEVLAFLEVYMHRLRGYVEDPPNSPREWDEYDAFIRDLFERVFSAFGR